MFASTLQHVQVALYVSHVWLPHFLCALFIEFPSSASQAKPLVTSLAGSTPIAPAPTSSSAASLDDAVTAAEDAALASSFGVLRCVAVSPDGCEVAAGDSAGNVLYVDQSTLTILFFP